MTGFDWVCAHCGRAVNRRSDGKGWQHSTGQRMTERPDHRAAPVRRAA